MTQPSIADIPDDVLIHVCKFLHMKDLPALFQTCKRMRCLPNEAGFWSDLATARWKSVVLPSSALERSPSPDSMPDEHATFAAWCESNLDCKWEENKGIPSCCPRSLLLQDWLIDQYTGEYCSIASESVVTLVLLPTAVIIPPTQQIILASTGHTEQAALEEFGSTCHPLPLGSRFFQITKETDFDGAEIHVTIIKGVWSLNHTAPIPSVTLHAVWAFETRITLYENITQRNELVDFVDKAQFGSQNLSLFWNGVELLRK